MMISKHLNDALNDEIGLEFFAHAQYLAMAVYFEQLSLDKLAAFFYDQAEEEKIHGLKIVRYLSETGAKVAIPAIDAPQATFKSAEELAQLFVDQEKHVTDQFYAMNKMSLDDGDYMTQSFLQWFINEQREEMATSGKLLDLVRMAGSNLLMVEMMVDNLTAAQAGGEAEAGGEAAAG